MSLTLSEIEEAILEAARGDWYQWEYEEISSDIDGLGVVTLLEDASATGGEGSAEYIFLVLQAVTPTSTRYFKKEGYYASYDGSNWDGDFKEVHPVTRQVTFYE